MHIAFIACETTPIVMGLIVLISSSRPGLLSPAKGVHYYRPPFIISKPRTIMAVERGGTREKSTVTISNGGPPLNIINESGLYSLILRSRKPEAKEFKKWVTSEVLPSIRKTGGYRAEMFDPASLSRLDILEMAMDSEHRVGPSFLRAIKIK